MCSELASDGAAGAVASVVDLHREVATPRFEFGEGGVEFSLVRRTDERIVATAGG